MGKNKDKICEECQPECKVSGKRWAEHCKQIHNNDSKYVLFWYCIEYTANVKD
jgi:hypothetical protein